MLVSPWPAIQTYCRLAALVHQTVNADNNKNSSFFPQSKGTALTLHMMYFRWAFQNCMIIMQRCRGVGQIVNTGPQQIGVFLYPCVVKFNSFSFLPLKLSKSNLKLNLFLICSNSNKNIQRLYFFHQCYGSAHE